MLKHLPRFHIRLLRHAAERLHPAEQVVIGLEAVCGFAHQNPLFLQSKLQLQGRDDLSYDLIL
jgi:hypothetical protein